MNTITITVIFILLLAYLGLLGIKRFTLNNVIQTLKKGDIETTLKLVDMGNTRKLLGNYTCDLYKIRCYYLAKDNDNFKQQMQAMINSNYDMDKKKSFLEQYFHTFLLKGNREYADLFLDAIRETNDQIFIHYNECSYEVMLNKRSDLIKELNDMIDSKKYYGFPLGVIVYMIAMQYLYLDKPGEALIHFQTTTGCFQPKALYMESVRKYIKELEQK